MRLVYVGGTGIEGVMRSCCEKTLGVLRKNKESLITIIEVMAILRDPQAYVCITGGNGTICCVLPSCLLFHAAAAFDCSKQKHTHYQLLHSIALYKGIAWQFTIALCKGMLCMLEQVFIHDPLYKWALTPLGAQQRQKDDLMVGDSNPAEPQSSAAGIPSDAVAGTDTTLANADAERALLRLKQKLAGMEGGERML